jgi:hypothetical protein
MYFQNRLCNFNLSILQENLKHAEFIVRHRKQKCLHIDYETVSDRKVINYRLSCVNSSALCGGATNLQLIVGATVSISKSLSDHLDDKETAGNSTLM